MRYSAQKATKKNEISLPHPAHLAAQHALLQSPIGRRVSRKTMRIGWET